MANGKGLLTANKIVENAVKQRHVATGSQVLRPL